MSRLRARNEYLLHTVMWAGACPYNIVGYAAIGSILSAARYSSMLHELANFYPTVRMSLEAILVAVAVLIVAPPELQRARKLACMWLGTSPIVSASRMNFSHSA